MGAKSKEATDLETIPLPSKPDEEKSENLKEEAIKRQIKNVEKIGEAGKPKAALAPSIKDDKKSKELLIDVKSNELKKSCQSKVMN